MNEKIYSRRRICIPNIYGNYKPNNTKLKKMAILISIIIIATITSKLVIDAISPIIDTQCMNMAKNIATKVSNEQTTLVMKNYQYEDLCIITKDLNGNVSMLSANTVALNQIISEITLKIQEELNKVENNKFNIRLGSFTGSRLLSSRGPSFTIKMEVAGNIETSLKSEIESSGINQTLHRIYLEIGCEVSVLTPFNTVKQKITNQVLLSEAIIIGTTPNTYCNF